MSRSFQFRWSLAYLLFPLRVSGLLCPLQERLAYLILQNSCPLFSSRSFIHILVYDPFRFSCAVCSESESSFSSLTFVRLFWHRRKDFPLRVEYSWSICWKSLPVSVYFCLCLLMDSEFCFVGALACPSPGTTPPSSPQLYRRPWTPVAWIASLFFFCPPKMVLTILGPLLFHIRL